MRSSRGSLLAHTLMRVALLPCLLPGVETLVIEPSWPRDREAALALTEVVAEVMVEPLPGEAGAGATADECTHAVVVVVVRDK